MTRRYWFLILMLLGVGIVLNPFYLYPDGPKERTYEVEPVAEERAGAELYLSGEMVNCARAPRVCVLEQRILSEGSLEYDGPVRPEFAEDYSKAGDYSLVGIDSQMYRPEQEATENGTRLSLTEISNEEAVDEVAVSADNVSPDIREAVETGSVSVSGRIPEFETPGLTIIEYDGEYYQRSNISGGSLLGTYQLSLLRVFLSVLGMGLIFYGWSRSQQIVE